LIGTFAVMHLFGFSLNNLSLFGLVLAIGIVVDDAIVVVENVERNIALGHPPIEATRIAMREVTGPIIATTLVLCAVFIPTAFISGISGQFYKQFAVTIAISTVISAINSLTLSPALSALLLQAHGSKQDLLSRMIQRSMSWLFDPFNRFFAWSSKIYVGLVRRIVRFAVVALLLYGGLLWLTYRTFDTTPTGFVPSQDKQYLIAFAQLPDGASLDRTEEVIRRMSDMALQHPGVDNSIAFPGLSIQGFSISPNSGIVFVGLKNFEQRTTPELSADAIAASLNAQFFSIKEALVLSLSPPPVNGIGTSDGFKLMILDRADAGYDALYQQTQQLLGRAMQSQQFGQTYSGYTVNVPQLDADVDREKAKSAGVPLRNLFDTLQINLGSVYVNDFNRFGRTWQVVAQADAQFRDHPEDIGQLKTRNAQGDMVPIASMVKITSSSGPDRVTHYNGYLAADLNSAAGPGLSSGDAESLIERMAKETLPPGFEPEWTDLVYQRILAGNSAVYIYPLCLLLVFLVLAAQYESLRMPLAIILIVPLCLLFALVGVVISDGDNNIFTQIGFIVLIGLACKNAILIVEFAREKQHEGLSAIDAALEACRLRLRPILMTSIAFIAGCYPLVVSTGAGAEMRRAMGTAVFSGMIGVTFFGLFLTPLFYVLLNRRAAQSNKITTAPHA
jgi:hydrophobe/amphiphile efflux-1 (HAE1) family protein